MSGGLWSIPKGATRKPRAPGAPKRKQPEATLQRSVVTLLSWLLAPPAWFTAIGHGPRGRGNQKGDEGYNRGAQWKGLGVKAGVPDLLIVYRGNAYWIELKAPKGVVSEDQKRAHLDLRTAGCGLEVCRSLEDVQKILAVWGIPTNKVRLSPAERASAIWR